MRFGEECPYITPCGWCSRKNQKCDMRKRRLQSACKDVANNTEQQTLQSAT